MFINFLDISKWRTSQRLFGSQTGTLNTWRTDKRAEKNSFAKTRIIVSTVGMVGRAATVHWRKAEVRRRQRALATIANTTTAVLCAGVRLHRSKPFLIPKEEEQNGSRLRYKTQPRYGIGKNPTRLNVRPSYPTVRGRGSKLPATMQGENIKMKMTLYKPKERTMIEPRLTRNMTKTKFRPSSKKIKKLTKTRTR